MQAAEILALRRHSHLIYCRLVYAEHLSSANVPTNMIRLQLQSTAKESWQPSAAKGVPLMLTTVVIL